MFAPQEKKAKLFRMVMDKHVCPFGVKSKWLLERRGFEVEDHWLTSREETDAFKVEHGVDTTPQTFLGTIRIGGYDDLRRHFGLSTNSPDETSYQPVIVVFVTAAAIALAISLTVAGSPFTIRTAEWFVSISMMLLAMLKLQNVEQFSTMFLNYDLLARKWVPYAYIYPFGEFLAGALMTAHLLPWLAIPIAAFLGSVGALSVGYAVYVQKREIKCACIGGASNVPLGFVSLTENLLMMAMAAWMLLRPV